MYEQLDEEVQQQFEQQLRDAESSRAIADAFPAQRANRVIEQQRQSKDAFADLNEWTIPNYPFTIAMAKMCEEVFPGKWDIQGGFVTVKCEDFTIRNSRGHEHHITDIYVRFEYSLNPGNEHVFGRLEGRRGTQTYTEYLSGYAHSHLPRNTKRWGNFCTGSDAINVTFGALSSTTWTEDNEDYKMSFMGFLVQLKFFMEWESIEGVPYFRMINIGADQSTNNINYYQMNGVLSKFMQRVSIEDFLNIDIPSCEVKLFKGDEFHKILGLCTPKQYRCYATPRGKLIQRDLAENGSREEFIDESAGSFNFRGEEIGLKIINDEVQELIGEATYTHPRVINYLQEYLKNGEQELFNIIRIHTTRRTQAEWESYPAYQSTFDRQNLTAHHAGE